MEPRFTSIVTTPLERLFSGTLPRDGEDGTGIWHKRYYVPGSKMRRRTCSGMPQPVSETATSTRRRSNACYTEDSYLCEENPHGPSL